jgi:hypothetical protein
LTTELLTHAVELRGVLDVYRPARLLEQTLSSGAEKDRDLHELVADVGPTLLWLLNELLGPCCQPGKCLVRPRDDGAPDLLAHGIGSAWTAPVASTASAAVCHLSLMAQSALAHH